MLEIGVWANKQYTTKFPAYAKMNAPIIYCVDSMLKLSVEEIDKQFQQAEFANANAAATGVDLSKEENGHFDNALDMIVHPSTVNVLLGACQKEKKAELVTRMQSEMQEVI